VEERRIYRTNKFRDYFKYSSIQELSIEEVQIEGEVIDPSGALLPLDWSLRITGLLIGLKNGNDDTLALGVIRNYFEEKKVIRILTPLREIQGVKTIQLSSIRHILLLEDESF
jgi:polynucleotide 5'-kinase involved in rRNA processing